MRPVGALDEPIPNRADPLSSVVVERRAELGALVGLE
jgi:hypothetical protein